MKLLILGASYGSLLSTKALMAGHDATLICRQQTAALINSEGTYVRLKLRDEANHRVIFSGDLPGNVDACTPRDARPEDVDLVVLAMQEPQYGEASVKELMKRVAQSGKPCLSIMNMPPIPYLKRMSALANMDLSDAYADPSVWEGFTPGVVSLCSPDPQAFRPAEEKANFLHVGLPTNFKASAFDNPAHTACLRQLEEDIAAVDLDGRDVPVKLRVYDSLFVPLAKWSMLLTGNYRCVTETGVVSIREAVHADLRASQSVYTWVDELAQTLGADPADQVPFEKYARAAESLLKPSSGARAIEAGAKNIERVDRLVMEIGKALGQRSDTVDQVVSIVDKRLEINRSEA